MTAPSLTFVSFHGAPGGRLSAIGPAMRPAENSARTSFSKLIVGHPKDRVVPNRLRFRQEPFLSRDRVRVDKTGIAAKAGLGKRQPGARAAIAAAEPEGRDLIGTIPFILVADRQTRKPTAGATMSAMGH
jgi:hypothetical protein